MNNTHDQERAMRIIAMLKTKKYSTKEIANKEEVSKTTVAHYKKKIGLTKSSKTKPKTNGGFKNTTPHKTLIDAFTESTKTTTYKGDTLVTLPLSELQKLRNTIVALAIRLSQ